MDLTVTHKILKPIAFVSHIQLVVVDYIFLLLFLTNQTKDNNFTFVIQQVNFSQHANCEKQSY